jgi:hypothetical protein
MTDQELKEAFETMSRKDFENLIHQHNLSLIVDTQGIGGSYGPPMYYVESTFDVPVRDRRTPLLVG